MTATLRLAPARTYILGILLALGMLLATGSLALADEGTATSPPAATTTPAAAPPGATGATGTVMQFGADPTVRIARKRHCVRTKLVIWPSYTGGGGVTAAILYINGRRVAKRHSAGALRISARRLLRGVNSYELISEFADGRAASAIGSIRRCR